MAFLTRDSKKKTNKSKDISIEPFNFVQLGPSSYDCTLSNEFRRFVHTEEPVDINENVDYKNYTELVNIADDEVFLLKPQETCLAITKETIKLGPSYCGLLEGRSRFARMGLAIHITASYIQPGINNRQVLEIFNCSNNTLALRPGTRICQFIFLKMDGKAKYVGRFQNQTL
jgi:dCTP deaminase